MDYRSITRISNSDLTEFRNLIFGYPALSTVKAFAFGTALHELVLEPRQIPDLPSCVDVDLVYQLASQVRADRYCAWALQFSQKESVQLWRDPATGLLLKSKLDIVYKDYLVIDIKSTGQNDYAGFLRSLKTYNYDRQAAFYLDSLNHTTGPRPRFLFVGVQKVKPFNIWIVEPSASFVAYGRQKYRALLREWKRRTDAGQPFTPSSWRTAPVPAETDLVLL